jgi:hypothetical protein
MRYKPYCKRVCQPLSTLQPEKLPPNERSAFFHVLRVHYQVVVWKNLSNDDLDPCQWGWHLVNGSLEPVATNLPLAPDIVLKMIKCQCRTGCTSALCSCRLNGHTCVSACSNCQGLTCANSGCKVIRQDSVNETQQTWNEMTQSDYGIYFADLMFDEDLDWIDEETVDVNQVQTIRVINKHRVSRYCHQVKLVKLYDHINLLCFS